MAVARREVSYRQVRWRASYNRHLLTAAIAVLAGVAVWRTVDPPRAVLVRSVIGATSDLPAEDYAARYAAAYLTYDGDRPERRANGLAELTGGDGAEDGFTPPATGKRSVLSVRVAQSSAAAEGRSYVVGADTNRDGRLYLAVTVARRGGILSVVGHPSIVGPPLQGGYLDAGDGATVDDAAARSVVRRALGNYLAGSADDLKADLAAGAVISLPSAAMRLDDFSELRWAPGGRSVVATVVASDRHGASMTLAYEVGVEQRGRWFVTGIQTQPTAH